MKNRSKVNALLLPFLIILVTVIATWMYVLQQDKPVPKDYPWTHSSLHKDWEVARPHQQNMDEQRLYNLNTYVERHNPKKRVQSILVARQGKLVFEQYYPVPAVKDGTPMPQYFPPSPDTPHQMRSITKTVVATLIGQLVTEGKLEPAQAIYPFYTDSLELLEPDKLDVTIEHALNFSSGLNWKEWGVFPSDAMNMWLSDDPYFYVLSKSLSQPPGTHYEYQGGMSVLLGGIIEKKLGVSLKEAATERLFEPLNFQNVEWFSHEKTGDYLGSSGLYLRSRDLAKLGQLYLNQGTWQGQQLFSKSWAERSLKPVGKFWPDKNIQYGYNWWFPRFEVNGKPLTVAAMRGSGGQEMVIIPKYQLIFTMTSGAYIGQDDNFPFQLLEKFVLPSLGLKEVKYRP